MSGPLDLQFLEIVSKLSVPITIGSLFFYGSASLVTTHNKVEDISARISSLALDQKIDRERSERADNVQDTSLARMETKLDMLVDQLLGGSHVKKNTISSGRDSSR